MKRRTFLKGLAGVASAACVPAVVSAKPQYFEGTVIKFNPTHDNTGGFILPQRVADEITSEINEQVMVISGTSNGMYDGEYFARKVIK